VALFFLCIVTADIGVYTFDRVNARVVGSFGAVQLLLVTGITDFFGLSVDLQIDDRDEGQERDW